MLEESKKQIQNYHDLHSTIIQLIDTKVKICDAKLETNKKTSLEAKKGLNLKIRTAIEQETQDRAPLNMLTALYSFAARRTAENGSSGMPKAGISKRRAISPGWDIDTDNGFPATVNQSYQLRVAALDVSGEFSTGQPGICRNWFSRNFLVSPHCRKTPLRQRRPQKKAFGQ